MKLFDYSELIRVIENVEIREEHERVMELLNLKNRYEELELSMIASGILDDWNRLKQLCKKANRRLCVSHQSDSSIGYVLGVGDFRYGSVYQDDGTISKCVSSGVGYSDYYGFVYECDKGVIWKTTHTTSSHHFDGFNENMSKSKYLTRIELLETFRDTYENYRKFQLLKIEEKFEQRVKIEDILK